MTPVYKIRLQQMGCLAGIILSTIFLPVLVYNLLWELPILYTFGSQLILLTINYLHNKLYSNILPPSDQRALNQQNPTEKAIAQYVANLCQNIGIKTPAIKISKMNPSQNKLYLGSKAAQHANIYYISLCESWLELQQGETLDDLLKVTLAHELMHLKNQDGKRERLATFFKKHGEWHFYIYVPLALSISMLGLINFANLSLYLLLMLTALFLKASNLITSQLMYLMKQAAEYLADFGAAQSTRLIHAAANMDKKTYFHQMHWGKVALIENQTRITIVSDCNAAATTQMHQTLHNLGDHAWEQCFDSLQAQARTEPTIIQAASSPGIFWSKWQHTHPTSQARKDFIQQCFPTHFSANVAKPTRQ